MAARGFLGAGDVYIARYVNGAFGAYEGPFEAGKFGITPNSELRELTSKGRTTYGQVIESVPVPQPFDFAVELREVNSTSLAIALMGTTGTITAQASGTLTDAPVVITLLDKWYDIGKANLNAAGITVENSGGTTTYVEGQDYLLNRTLGWIKALPGGTIAAASTVNVSGAYGSVDGSEIVGGTQTQIRAKFKLDGVNMADGLPCIVTVHEATGAPDAEMDFLADDFGVVSLNMRMKTPSGFTGPFTVHLRNA